MLLQKGIAAEWASKLTHALSISSALMLLQVRNSNNPALTATAVQNACIFGAPPAVDWCSLLCRSVLAEAMFKRLLASCRTSIDVTAESASIGPAAEGAHDASLAAVAREAGLALPQRQPRIFDEMRDIVHYDLVLVMDKFDLEAVSWQGLASICIRRHSMYCLLDMLSSNVVSNAQAC